MALLKRSYAFTVVALFLLLSLCTGCRESPDERIRKDVAAAQDLIEQGDNERALELLLEAQARLDESVSWVRITILILIVSAERSLMP